MNRTFGIFSQPRSTRWSDVAKGPSLDAVREHVVRVAGYGASRQSSGPAR